MTVCFDHCTGHDDAAGGDRGDNTALCPAPLCPGFDGAFCDTCPRRTLPLTDVPDEIRQTDEERCGCFEPGCPTCTCPAARPAVADAVTADLGAAITQGVTEVKLREAVAQALAASDPVHMSAMRHYVTMADAVLALPAMRALIGAAAKVQRVEVLVARAGRFAINPAAVRAALGGEGE